MMKTKLDGERNLILTDMRKMEAEIREMKATYEGQLRLISSVTGHARNKAALLTEQGSL
jgi:hypothetical protein